MRTAHYIRARGRCGDTWSKYDTRTTPSPLLASRVTGTVVTIHIAFSSLKIQLGNDSTPKSARSAPAKSTESADDAAMSAA